MQILIKNSDLHFRSENPLELKGSSEKSPKLKGPSENPLKLKGSFNVFFKS